MKQFLTGDVWGQVNKSLNGRRQITACIAYVTSKKLHLKKDGILVCDASPYAIKYAETSAKTLKFYFKKGVQIYSNNCLHSKLLIRDGLLVVGSANLSKNSAARLVESAVITDDKSLISQAMAFCYNLKEESRLLTKEVLSKLLAIKVVRRPSPTYQKSATRGRQFSSNYWFKPVFPLDDKGYEAIKEKIEATTKSISKTEDIKENNISFIQSPRTERFAKKCKEGDMIIIKFSNENGTRSDVFSPSTVLKKEINGRDVIIYHDDTLTESVTWTTFRRMVTSVGLGRKSFARTSSLTESELKVMKQIWED